MLSILLSLINARLNYNSPIRASYADLESLTHVTRERLVVVETVERHGRSLKGVWNDGKSTLCWWNSLNSTVTM